MKIKFSISRPLNLYYLLRALTKNRYPELKELFREKYGTLKNEQELLDKFLKIRGKFRSCCMLSKDRKSLLKKIGESSSDEFKTFAEEVVSQFYEKSKDMLEEFIPRLEKRKEQLENKFTEEREKVAAILERIKKLYGVKKMPKVVKVILAINLSKTGHCFGENPMDPKYYLILGPTNLIFEGDFIKNDMAVIFHELAHFAEDTSPIWNKKAEKSSLKNWEKITKKYDLTEEEKTEVVNEAIADNLFPNGFFSLEYGLISKEQYERRLARPKEDLRDILGEKIRERTLEQSKSNQCFFEEDYLDYVCSKLREIKS